MPESADFLGKMRFLEITRISIRGTARVGSRPSRVASIVWQNHPPHPTINWRCSREFRIEPDARRAHSRKGCARQWDGAAALRERLMDNNDFDVQRSFGSSGALFRALPAVPRQYVQRAAARVSTYARSPVLHPTMHAWLLVDKRQREREVIYGLEARRADLRRLRHGWTRPRGVARPQDPETRPQPATADWSLLN